MKKNLIYLAAIAVISLFIVNPAFADMPWQSGLEKLEGSLTGPVASTLAIMGLIGSGAMLIFGGEISGFIKSLVYIVLVASVILCANKMIDMIGTDPVGKASGAVISYAAPTFDCSQVYAVKS